MSDFKCTGCGGSGYIDHGDLVVFPGDEKKLTSPCRKCGGSGIFVSRARAGLVCVPVPSSAARAA